VANWQIEIVGSEGFGHPGRSLKIWGYARSRNGFWAWFSGKNAILSKHCRMGGTRWIEDDITHYFRRGPRPDKIEVGEISYSPAHDSPKAWNTGHNTGCCTLHANSVEKAFFRLK
jgi:hypothetical protein